MTSIELYSGQLTDEIGRLADSYEFKPYFFVSAAPPDGLNTILRNRISRFLTKAADNKSAAFFLANNDKGELEGFCAVEILDFDSAVLKIQSGRIPYCVTGSKDYNAARPVADALIDAAMSWLRERDVVFTNIRTAALELPVIHAVEKAGFYLVDNGITALYHKDNAPKYEKSGYDIRLFAEKDLQTVLEIMRGAYTHDRFHLDPKIPHDAAEELYQLWIHHCCT
ncbi:MAG TPA: hypothetical protein ENN67_00975, partial [Firmicutes bacterium]|nr:hypothetical protein [Bacillota bacterium]